jgi:ubiquinone/menaquinone biosynthesis C-methylase UbiE
MPFINKMIFGKHFPYLFLPLRKIPVAIQAPLKAISESLRLSLQMGFGTRINRNQWRCESKTLTYRKLMTWSWKEIELYAPKYFNRLKFSLSKASGKVLELGCGIGTMTRWLSKSVHVEHIWAVDAFEEAIKVLKSFNMRKVTPLRLPVEDLGTISKIRFDTVLMCELLEHLYPDEETKMLKSLYSLTDSTTKFVVSVPVGSLQDPHHVRSFSKERFKRHLIKFYGEPIEIDYSAVYSQVAWGYFNLEFSE